MTVELFLTYTNFLWVRIMCWRGRLLVGLHPRLGAAELILAAPRGGRGSQHHHHRPSSLHCTGCCCCWCRDRSGSHIWFSTIPWMVTLPRQEPSADGDPRRGNAGKRAGRALIGGILVVKGTSRPAWRSHRCSHAGLLERVRFIFVTRTVKSKW